MFKRTKPTDTSRQPLRSVTPRDARQVFSYRAARQQREDGSERHVEVRQQPHRNVSRHRLRILAGIVLVVGLFMYLSWLDGTPNVVVVGSNSQRTLLQDTKVYQQAAAKLISASWANHNKLTLDTNGIAAKLEKQFPELESVSVQPPLLGHEPQIYIQPAAPAVTFVSSVSGKFVLAANGKALAYASQVSDLNKLQLPTVTDQSGLPIHIGSSALSATSVSFVELLVNQFRAKHLVISSITLPQGTSELDVRVAGKPYAIKFNWEADASQQVGTYLAVNKYLQEHNVTPAQYVDVRVPGRAYYK